MRVHFRQAGSPRRRHRPGFESLEARDVPSTTTIAAHSALPGHAADTTLTPIATPSAPSAQAAEAALAQTVTTKSRTGQTPFPDPAVIANSINLIYGPNSLTPRTPTPAEVKRETFVARYVGTYTVGTPRFSDRSVTIHAYSKTGGSNQFLKGKLQIVLFPPANSDAQPTPGNPYVNQVTGIASLFTQNYLQTGGLLILDLNATPVAGSDPNALPTHLNWTYDSFSSAGPYTGPTLDFFQGAGVVDIHYIPDPHPNRGTLGSGHFIASFQGVINTNQIISAISKGYN